MATFIRGLLMLGGGGGEGGRCVVWWKRGREGREDGRNGIERKRRKDIGRRGRMDGWMDIGRVGIERRERKGRKKGRE